MGSTQLRTTFISLSALLGLDRLLAFLPSSFFFPFSFVAPMTAYDDLMPDSSGPADVMYNILGCRHSSLCNILQQPLEHIDDYDAGVGGQSENEHFPVAARRDFFLQDYRTPAPAIFARLFSFYTLYYKRLGYAFLFDFPTFCTILLYFLPVSQGTRTTETLLRYYDDRTVTDNPDTRIWFHCVHLGFLMSKIFDLFW
jgi:hypothetical protein